MTTSPEHSIPSGGQGTGEPVTQTMTASTAATTEKRELGLLARIFGVLVAPRDTYAAVVARPRIFGVLMVSLLIIAGAQVWFLSSDIGKEALLEQQVSTMEAFGVNVTDEMYAGMESRLAYAPYTTAGGTIVVMPIYLAILAGLFMMVFNVFLGGDATYKQVYALLSHSLVIAAVQALFNAPINYARGDMSSATRLSVFFPMFEEMSFATYLLSAIDLVLIWSLISISIGMAVLYKRRTGRIATGLLGIYAVIALIIAFVRAF